MKIESIVPFIGWIRRYKKQDLSGDLIAGLTVAIMLVPQGMAYAMLAGLPPVTGLYASTVPLLAYALLGTSRQLAVGPVAIISLLVSVAAVKFAPAGSREYIAVALILALMTGVLQLAFGLLRLGFVVNFLSHAVISGFTTAAALVIGLSQLKHLLGIGLTGGHSVFHLLYETGQKIAGINLVTLVIGLVSITVLVIFKKKYPRFPAPLLVVLLGTLAVFFLELDRQAVAVVGNVPGGFPLPSLPSFHFNYLAELFPVAMAIVLVGYMESFAVAQTIASREKYKINANKEFLGLGLANIAAAFFSGYPVTGGFSRTAVNHQAGGRTALSSIITAVLVALTLIFLTPLFYYLPRAVLAAIIMVAVYGLMDLKQAVYLFKLKPVDGWTLVLTFACTLGLGIEQGIIIGVGFSLLLFIWRSAHPHTAELGYVKKEDAFLNIERFPQARIFPGVLILRVDSSMYFANTRFIQNQLRERLVDRPRVKRVVFDLSGVNDVDAVAVHGLAEMIAEYREQDIRFDFAGMKGPVRDFFKKAGWQKKQGTKIEYKSLRHTLEEIGCFGRKKVNP